MRATEIGWGPDVSIRLSVFKVNRYEVEVAQAQGAADRLSVQLHRVAML